MTSSELPGRMLWRRQAPAAEPTRIFLTASVRFERRTSRASAPSRIALVTFARARIRAESIESDRMRKPSSIRWLAIHESRRARDESTSVRERGGAETRSTSLYACVIAWI
jgi:hypothetical protein